MLNQVIHALTRNFAANLLAYAIGRRVEYYDQPAVRAIVRDAAEDDYRMSAFVLGVVRSDAFRMMRARTTAQEPDAGPLESLVPRSEER